MPQANASPTTCADLPPISPEMLLIGLMLRTMGPKARARFAEALDTETAAVQVVRLRGSRPSVAVLDAYHQASALASKLGVL